MKTKYIYCCNGTQTLRYDKDNGTVSFKDGTTYFDGTPYLVKTTSPWSLLPTCPNLWEFSSLVGNLDVFLSSSNARID